MRTVDMVVDMVQRIWLAAV